MTNWISFLFIIFPCLLWSQVNEEFVHEDLKSALAKLENKYHINISYDAKLVKGISVSTKIENASMPETFKKLFRLTQLSFKEVKPNYYILVPSTKNWLIESKLYDLGHNTVPYAKIKIVGHSHFVYADQNGHFNINFICDSPPLLEISCLGFKTKVISSLNATKERDVQLSQDILEFSEVKVEYLTEGITTSDDISKITIRPSKIGPVPGTTESDIFQTVQGFPGVNSANSSVSEIQIRGGTGDQNHLIWDNIPIYHPGHFNGMFSAINPIIVNKTDIYKDVYDPYYGGKASGLIDLKSINHVPSKFETGGGINLIQMDTYIKTPLRNKKMGLLVSARRSYMDLWKTPTYLKYAERVYQQSQILNTDDLSTNDNPFFAPSQNGSELWNQFMYADFNFKFIYKPSHKKLLTVSSMFIQNRLQYLYIPISEVSIVNSSFNFSRNIGLNINYKRIWTDQFKSDLILTFSRYNYKLFNSVDAFYDFSTEVTDESVNSYLDSISNTQSVFKSNTINHHLINLNNKYTFNKNHSINGGAQLSYLDVKHFLFYNNLFFDTISEFGSTQGFSPAFHFNYKFNNKRLLLNLGVRLSYFSVTQKMFIEPRLYGQYKVTDKLTMKSSFGMQNQMISQVDQFGEINLDLASRIWVMANSAEIPVVKSKIFNTGFRYLHKSWHIEFDFYLKEINNIVNFSDDTDLSFGLLRGDAYAGGVDFLIKRRWKRVRSWLSYSFNSVLYEFNSYSNTFFEAPFSQPHILKWINTLNYGNFEFSSTFKIASGKPYTPAVGINTIRAYDPVLGEEVIIDNKIQYGDHNSKFLPTFHQLDISAFYTFPKKEHKRGVLKIGVSCFNIYNKQNILSRQYRIENIGTDELGNELFQTYTIEKYYLGFTPNAVIRYKF